MMRRRDRRRQETIDDIKDTARSQLADAGPAGISMRAIARHLAITASAVHYYFPSRQALLDALVVDGFTSPDGALAACMITYAQLHGAITLELLGHVPPPLADYAALFDLEMVHAYAALCRPPFT